MAVRKTLEQLAKYFTKQGKAERISLKASRKEAIQKARARARAGDFTHKPSSAGDLLESALKDRMVFSIWDKFRPGKIGTAARLHSRKNSIGRLNPHNKAIGFLSDIAEYSSRFAEGTSKVAFTAASIPFAIPLRGGMEVAKIAGKAGIKAGGYALKGSAKTAGAAKGGMAAWAKRMATPHGDSNIPRGAYALPAAVGVATMPILGSNIVSSWFDRSYSKRYQDDGTMGLTQSLHDLYR